jgi:FMN phosphatase YigB (HAD superfamily)
MQPLSLVHTLTFDAFGTILDLGTSHAPRLRDFLKSKGSGMTPEQFWGRWRYRQRIEQYQDNQFYTGHFGYLDSSRRALLYVLRSLKLPFDDADIRRIMDPMPWPASNACGKSSSWSSSPTASATCSRTS